MAVADDLSDAVRLAAIRDALDRAGLSVRAGVDVEIAAERVGVVGESGGQFAAVEWVRTGLRHMEESLPPSSRIDKAAPFHIQLEAAFNGVSQAIAAVEEIRASEEFASFIESGYSHIICATLKVEVDGLQNMVGSVGVAPVDSRREKGRALCSGRVT